MATKNLKSNVNSETSNKGVIMQLATRPRPTELATRPRPTELATRPKTDKLATRPRPTELATRPRPTELATRRKTDKLAATPKSGKSRVVIANGISAVLFESEVIQWWLKSPEGNSARSCSKYGVKEAFLAIAKASLEQQGVIKFKKDKEDVLPMPIRAIRKALKATKENVFFVN